MPYMTDLPAGADPTETLGRCATCSGPIRHLSGVSWRHIGRYMDRAKGNHPADPDEATRDQMREAAA